MISLSMSRTTESLEVLISFEGACSFASWEPAEIASMRALTLGSRPGCARANSSTALTRLHAPFTKGYTYGLMARRVSWVNRGWLPVSLTLARRLGLCTISSRFNAADASPVAASVAMGDLFPRGSGVTLASRVSSFVRLLGPIASSNSTVAGSIEFLSEAKNVDG